MVRARRGDAAQGLVEYGLILALTSTFTALILGVFGGTLADILGFIGNAIFSTRFLLQWIASEKKGESVIPVAFWYWSILGSAVLGSYFIFKRDPVGILAYLPNSFIYIRNLQLIKRQQQLAAAAQASPTTRH